MSIFKERTDDLIEEGTFGREEFDNINKYSDAIIKFQALHVWYMLIHSGPGKEVIVYNKSQLEKAEKFLEERRRAKKEAADEPNN